MTPHKFVPERSSPKASATCIRSAPAAKSVATGFVYASARRATGGKRRSAALRAAPARAASAEAVATGVQAEVTEKVQTLCVACACAPGGCARASASGPVRRRQRGIDTRMPLCACGVSLPASDVNRGRGGAPSTRSLRCPSCWRAQRHALRAAWAASVGACVTHSRVFAPMR